MCAGTTQSLNFIIGKITDLQKSQGTKKARTNKNQKLYNLKQKTKQDKHWWQKFSALQKEKKKKLTNIHTAWGSAVSHFQVLMFHQIINTIWPIEAKEKYKKERNKIIQAQDEEN